MLDYIKNFPGRVLKVLAGILSVFGVIAFLYEEKKKEAAEAKLETAEADKKDAVLQEKQVSVETHIAEVVAAGEEAKKQELTPEELAKELGNV